MKVTQKQVEVEDCGLFSIAFNCYISIAFGQNPKVSKVNASILSQSTVLKIRVSCLDYNLHPL